MSEYILEINEVVKEFPGVKALDKVSFGVKKGHIHGLVGENGAGKSTLMKILSGVYPKGEYTGEIRINGEHVEFKGVSDSEKAGIGIIYQELMMVPELSIAENIFLGRCKSIVDWNKLNQDAKKWMAQVGLDDNPTTPVKNIGTGKQQLVEIAKALSLDTKLLILDEPTASLTETEVENLLKKLDEIRKDGVTCIYISHKLEEVLSICDEVTIIRDGTTIDTKPVSELNEQIIISKMVGREFTNRFPKRPETTPGDVMLKLENINLMSYDIPDKYILENINLEVRAGEIVGIAGLMGAGRTELVNSVFGDFRGKLSGGIYISGKRTRIKSPKDAIAAGLGLVTEDRKNNGLNLVSSIENNILMACMDKYTRLGVINENRAIKDCKEISDRIKIKTNSMSTLAMNLSGGNQQKVVLAKWLMVSPKILIIDEPTRGIDVGAKYEIYVLMNELKKQGMAIIMVSSELPEVLGMSDRVVVLKEGRITGEFENNALTEEKIMEKATGGNR